MRYMTKPIISNILLFIETLLLFSITLILSFKMTILNEKYIEKTLKKTNYYEYIYEETKNTMKYITRKSNLSGKILEDTFTIEDVTNDINSFVKSFYKGEKLILNTEHLKENINKNIKTYIEENQIELTDEQIKDYTNKMILTYKNEIRLMNNFTNESTALNKYNKISSILLLLFIIDLIVLIIINKKIFKKKEYDVLLLSSIISLIGTNIFISTLKINNIFIYNNKVSEVIKVLVNKLQIKNFMFILLYIIIGIIIFKRKKEIEE